MAKIRVYELARELNLKNKDLLGKLQEMDISVGSHMSSLDDETVARIKANLVGKKDTSDVVTTRVRPTVIRRRRKKWLHRNLKPSLAIWSPKKRPP
jgi:translation initiation factor IF-2